MLESQPCFLHKFHQRHHFFLVLLQPCLLSLSSCFILLSSLILHLSFTHYYLFIYILLIQIYQRVQYILQVYPEVHSYFIIHQNIIKLFVIMFDLVFATEIPSSRYRSIGENQSVELKKKRNGSIRIKEVKSEMKKVNEEYNKTLRSFVRAKNSLDKTNQRAHQLRVDFMKSYGSKKLHIQEKMLQNYRKQQEEEFQNQNNKRIKAMRLTNQLGLMYTRNQHQLLQSKIREKNKKQQQHFKNQLKLRKSQWMDEAKQKYLEVKKGEVELFVRKNNHTSMISSRAHHNYLNKVQRQVQMLESYNSLMDKVNVLNTTLPVMQTSSQNQNLSKIFVTTTKNTFFQTQ